MVNNLTKEIEQTGISKMLSLIDSLLTGFKPIINIVDKFSKLLAMLLSPISMLITGLLYPILLMMKPIIMVFNQFIKPFFALALQFFRASGKAGTLTPEGLKLRAEGVNILLQGMGLFLGMLAMKIIQTFTEMFINLITFIMDVITFGQFSEQLWHFAENVNKIISEVMADIFKLPLNGIAEFAKSQGMEVANFEKQTSDAINSMFNVIDDTAEEESVKSGITGIMSIMSEVGKVGLAFQQGMWGFTEAMIKKSKKILGIVREKANEQRKTKSGGK